jgi:hypothetical protein
MGYNLGEGSERNKLNELNKKLNEYNLIINEATVARDAIQVEINRLQNQQVITRETSADIRVHEKKIRLYQRIKQIYNSVGEYNILKDFLDSVNKNPPNFYIIYKRRIEYNPITYSYADILEYLVPDHIKSRFANREEIWKDVARFTRKYIVKYIRIYAEYVEFLKYNQNSEPKSKIKYKGEFMQYKKANKMYKYKIKRSILDMLNHATFVILKQISRWRCLTYDDY